MVSCEKIGVCGVGLRRQENIFFLPKQCIFLCSNYKRSLNMIFSPQLLLKIFFFLNQ